MLKILSFVLSSIIIMRSAEAQMPLLPVYSNDTFANEIRTLAAMGGYAEACNIKTELKTFEVIITDLIHNVSVSDSDEVNYKRLYLQEKMRFYNSYRNRPVMSCKEVKEHFFNQSIFSFMKNPDGSMIDPNGNLIKRGEPLPF